MEDPTQLTEGDLDDAAMALATAQAKLDSQFLADLQARNEGNTVENIEVMEAPPEPVRIPMNRGQRRAQVKQYARLLTLTERQEPVIIPTIIPRSKRRRQKNNRRAS